MDFRLYGTPEKQAIILEIGAYLTKCGFAGEPTPRAIVPTTLQLSNGKQLFLTTSNSATSNSNTSSGISKASSFSQKEWNEALENFLHSIYYVYLQCVPKERKVVIVENILLEKSFRNALAHVLFEKLKVSSILLSTNLPTVLLPVTKTSALVIDSGYTETRVLPVYEGTGLIYALKIGQGLAMQAIHNRLRTLLCSHALISNPFSPPDTSLSRATSPSFAMLHNDALEDFTFRHVFIRPDPSQPLPEGLIDLETDSSSSSPSSTTSPATVDPRSFINGKGGVKYTLGSDKVLHVPGFVRYRCSESVFQGNEEDESIATLILDSLLRCKPDTRVELARNLILIGGTTELKGFKDRLLYELKKLTNENKRYSTLKALSNDFDFVESKYPPVLLSWIGGSVIGSLETDQPLVTRQSYLEKKKLPDWTSLLRPSSSSSSSSGSSTLPTSSSSSSFLPSVVTSSETLRVQ